MGIVIPETVNVKKLTKSLEKRGWRLGKFNKKKAYMKEEEEWLWIVIIDDEAISFFSFSEHDKSEHHSIGVNKLKKEVEQIGKEVGFSIPKKLEEFLWNY